MSPQARARAGALGLSTGVVGALAAGVLLLWPAQVSDRLVSYPFTTRGFYVAQAGFFVHHLGLVILLAVFARSAGPGAGRLARGGAWLAVVGTVLLTGAELLAMRYAEWDQVTANEGVMGASYGIACTAVGLGMLAAGVGTLRGREWSGWRAWTPLSVGVAQFVVLTPGMFGGFVLARLAIGVWMLTFAAVGWSMRAEARPETAAAANPRAQAVLSGG